MAKSTKQSNGGDSAQSPAGAVTKQVIDLFPRLSDRVVSEFRAEPCPPEQEAAREAAIQSWNEAVALAVAGSRAVVETLPSAAVAALDRDFTDFHIVETGTTLLGREEVGIKDLIIGFLRGLIDKLPISDLLKVILKCFLDIVQAFQKLF